LAEAIALAKPHEPKPVTDMRRVLDDDAVTAVWIATPDHWHGPATLLSLAAGKHVYVEKPAAHNIREGRLMLDAARSSNRVVQVGTQSRSTAHVKRAVELLRQGAIGEVRVAKAWNSQKRANIGHASPSDPPRELDFDLWLGPAPKRPYQSNILHSIWRWWRPFGTGDIGNDGVHDLDIARWGLGATGHPTAISTLGRKLVFDDDQEFPDTMYCAFEYAPEQAGGKVRHLIYEQRDWSPYVQEGNENGNAFYGTEGMLILGKGTGFQLYGPRNKLVEEMRGSPDLAAHHEDFLNRVRSGEPARANADIAEGHLSAALAHLGNIGCFLGRSLRFDPAAETFPSDSEAATLVSRAYREGHWAAPADSLARSASR
jgi:predicted dehydrogenase